MLNNLSKNNNQNNFNHAKKLYLIEENKFRENVSNSKNKTSLKLIEKGTFEDKIAAIEELVAQDPFHSLYLIQLIFQVPEKPKSQLKSLFSFQNLLLNNYKNHLENICWFSENTFINDLENIFFFNGLRELFEKFTTCINKLIHSNISFIVLETTKMTCNLVSKLNDKLAHNLLSILISSLPLMNESASSDAIKTIDIALSHRSLLTSKLVQEITSHLLSKKDNDYRLKLIDVLCSVKFSVIEDRSTIEMFVYAFLNEIKNILVIFSDKKLLRQTVLKVKRKKNKGNFKNSFQAWLERESRFMSKSLKGLNLCLPYLGTKKILSDFLGENISELFSLAHTMTSKATVQLLVFFYGMLSEDLSQPIASRFLTFLYIYLDEQEIYFSSLFPLLLDLLFNILKKDSDLPRVCAFLKKVLSFSIHSSSKTIVAILIMLAKIIEARPSITKMIPEIKTSSATSQVIERIDNFDPHKRNPSFAQCDTSSFTEIYFLKNHYNPTIRKIAHLIHCKKFSEVDYKSNPFEKLSSANLIKRFSLQPLKVVKNDNKKRKKEDNINSVNFTALQDDEEAIKKYFEQKLSKLNFVRKETKDTSSQEDVDNFADNLIEEEMKKAQDPYEEDYFSDESNYDEENLES